ncbi:MAG: iron-sulfur cluster assembly accessory protein [Planctomycetota bacterium]
MSVGISTTAVKELKNIIKENEMPDNTAVRMGVKGGGCSGFSYVLDFCVDKNESDIVFETEGIKVFVDPKSNIFLDGTTLDFKNGLLDRGFIWKNPSATGTCGCGSSFSV